MSEATETFARSRSSLDTNPLVSPLCSATSAMVLRAASLAALSCAPILVPSGTAGGVPFPLLVLGISPPSRSWRRDLDPFLIMTHQDPVMKQWLTYRKHVVIIAYKARHI